MTPSIKYILGAAISLPLLPIMYVHGKNIRSSVPKLPEAIGTKGVSGAENTRSMHMLVIGESTIAGVGVETHAEGFAGTLADALATQWQTKIDWRVYARSGYTAERIRHKILPKIEETATDLIVVGLGGNDAFTLNSPWKWKADVDALIHHLRSSFGDVPILFTNMPPIKEFPAFTPVIKFTIGNLVELLGDSMESLVKNHENVFYNAERIHVDEWVERLQIIAEETTFFSDGVHPSKFTYQVWAQDFAAFINHSIPNPSA